MDQETLDQIYLQQVAEYEAQMKLERIRNWFQIASAFAGIMVALFVFTHKKFQ